jgi:hypothetical protein
MCIQILFFALIEEVQLKVHRVNTVKCAHRYSIYLLSLTSLCHPGVPSYRSANPLAAYNTRLLSTP